jgi:hypothetical protein
MTKKTIDLTKKNFLKWLKEQPEDRGFKVGAARFCPIATYTKDKLNSVNEDFHSVMVGFNQLFVYDSLDNALLKFYLPKWADDFYHEVDETFTSRGLVNKNDILPLLKAK